MVAEEQLAFFEEDKKQLDMINSHQLIDHPHLHTRRNVNQRLVSHENYI